MTRLKHGLAKHLLPLAFLGFIGASQSALAAPCADQMNTLQAAVNDNICSYSKACSGLSHKLDNANHKLEQGKFRHAARKLADFSAVLENLALHKKPQISMADYESLIEPFNAAANCVANGGVVVAEEVVVIDDPANDTTPVMSF